MLTKSIPTQTHLPPLRAVRRARGWSLRSTAVRAEIDPGYLSKIERGQREPSVEALYRLAAALELRELATLLKPYVTTRRAA